MAKSRMSREVHVRFREGLGVQLPRATRLIVMVRSAKAAVRVMASLIRFVEGKLKLMSTGRRAKPLRSKHAPF